MGLFNFFSRTGYTDEHRNRILIGIKSLDETVYNQLMHPSTGYVSDKQLDIAYAKAELSYLTKVSNSKHADTSEIIEQAAQTVFSQKMWAGRCHPFRVA